jgi:hypothetical protein
MTAPELPDPIPARLKLEDLWRTKLEEAQKKYLDATARYRQLLVASAHGSSSAADSPLAQARQVQSEALAEYTRVLRAFTDLAVNGRVPKEPASPADDGSSQ